MQCNDEGFLLNTADWSEPVAHQLAASDGINLSDAHFEIIYLVRQFYQDYDHSPSMRPLVKYVKTQLSADKGNSIYLLTLFPESPAKLACKIAGVPKPEKCL